MTGLEKGGTLPMTEGVVYGPQLPSVHEVYDMFAAGMFDERPEPEVIAAVVDTPEVDSALETAPIDDDVVIIGRGVVSATRSRSERIRDSIASHEERHAAKVQARAEARAERIRLRKQGLRPIKPARDGYLPGNRPRKPSPWNKVVALAMLQVEFGLDIETI